MTILAVLLCVAQSVRAMAPAALSATTPESEGGTAWKDSGLYGTGWTVTAGYFFKDTMFYSQGRGGPAVSVGKAFRVLRWLGIRAGGGVLRAKGTMNTSGAGSGFRTTFDSTVMYADLGIVTPWLPFPVSLAFYRHATDLTDAAGSGALYGRTFRGSATGTGLGADVRIEFEFFSSKRRAPHRGPGIVLGYSGFMDFSPKKLGTRDAAGVVLEHPKWKPFAGEGLHAGLEYEF
ncbi:MAG: hypothetical protein AAB152_13400 [Candidatus Coatesbacteria bacterium]